MDNQILNSNVTSSNINTTELLNEQENNENKTNDEKKQTDQDQTEFSLEDIFINLTLISRIDVGNKLIRSGKYINIDTGYLQFIMRWINGQNRAESIKYTAIVLSKAFEYCDNLTKKKDDESRQYLLRLNTTLTNVIGGLSNLSQTYHYDKLTQSEIDVMINNIRTKLNIQSKHIHFVEKEKSENSIDNDEKFVKKDPMSELKNAVLENIKKEKREHRENKEHKENEDLSQSHPQPQSHSSSHVKKKSL
jgi:hypothetical protein